MEINNNKYNSIYEDKKKEEAIKNRIKLGKDVIKEDDEEDSSLERSLDGDSDYQTPKKNSEKRKRHNTYD